MSLVGTRVYFGLVASVGWTLHTRGNIEKSALIRYYGIMNDDEGKGKNLYDEPVKLLEYKEPVPFPGTIKAKKKRTLSEWVELFGCTIIGLVLLGIALLLLFLLLYAWGGS